MNTDDEVLSFRSDGLAVLHGYIAHSDIEDLRILTDDAYKFVDEVDRNPASRSNDDVGIRVRECNEFGWITFDDLSKFASAKGTSSDVLRRVASKIFAVAKELASYELTMDQNAIAKIRNYVQRRFGGYCERSKHLTDCSVVRRVSERIKQPTVQWHRDFNAAYSESGKVGLNFWVPLIDVGNGQPSLEIIKKSNLVLSKLPKERSHYSNEDLQRLFAQVDVFVPVMRAGDVCVFDQHTVHRTQPYPSGAAVHRTSCEFRFIFN